MLIHIVKTNETLSSIAKIYHISKNDIITSNGHIRDFTNLHVGTKLNIPLLNENTFDILDQTEPFISDFYQSNVKDVKEEIIDPIMIDSKEKDSFQEKQIKEDDTTNAETPIILEESDSFISEKIDNEKKENIDDKRLERNEIVELKEKIDILIKRIEELEQKQQKQFLDLYHTIYSRFYSYYPPQRTRR